MLSNISPLRHNSREDGANRSDRTKPQGQPRNDDFRKSMKDKPPKKNVEEHAVDEHEEAPSLFDLSKSKTKNKSSLTSKSSLKDSDSSNLVSNRPLTAKQGDQGQKHDESEEDSNESLSSEEGIETTRNDIPQANDDFYATAAEPSDKDGFLTTKTLQDQTLKQTKLPVQQPLDGLKPELAAHAASTQRSKVPREESSFETDKLGQTPKKQKAGKSEESKSDAATEAKEGAAATINASIQSVAFQTEKTEETQETISSATVREIATQIVDRIQVMRKDNETQTIITLRHPPILEGATITLTASDHAKREFNIAFANLSPDAKLLLDRKFKEDSLTETLERKGITVHMLTTSTQSENIITADAGQASRDRQDQQQQQQERDEQQRRQNFSDSEEEEGVS